MIFTPKNINPPEDETSEQADTQAASARRFPAISQLAILGIVLVFLLGSAGWSYFSRGDIAANDVWVAVDIQQSKQPQASLTTTTIKSLEEITIEAKAGFVYDVANKQVLYQKAADEALPIASVTKLMTILVAHELLSDDTAVSIPYTATVVESASGLGMGERLLTRSLMNYAMLASSNDAAQSLATAGATAISEGASEAVFVEAMNVRAKELGLSTLSFRNAHGLDIDATQAGAYGSARDITFLMEYLYKNYPDLLSVTTNDTARIYNTSGDFHSASNTNRILNEIPQLRGSKTGYTILAGGNLTIVFDAAPNRPIIVTVLGSSFTGRFLDVQNLIEATQKSLIE